MKLRPHQTKPGEWEERDESPCVLAVFYEDTHSRNRAVGLCRRLASEGHGDVPLAISWWKFTCLEESQMAKDATQAAICADAILVATSTDRALPQILAECLGHSARLRSKPHGLLVGLVHVEESGHAAKHPVLQKLKSLATIASWDFLPDSPNEAELSHDDWLNLIEHQAHDLSATLRPLMKPRDESSFGRPDRNMI